MSACFGKTPDERYFAWKYAENPAGKVVAFEALWKGQIAGFYGVIPWYLSLGSKRMRVFQSMDTMTHPSFQRRGLFVRLAQATYAALAGLEPDHVIVGIPGQTSYPGFVQKLGWTHVFDWQYIFKPRAFAVVRGRRDEAVRTITGLEGGLDRYLESRRSGSNRFQVSLDPAFFAWRVFENPAGNYETLLVESGAEPIGVSVISRKGSGRFFLELLDCVSDDLWGAVVGAVTAHLFETHKASIVYTWKPADGLRSRAFSRSLFIRNPFGRGPFSYRVPFIVRSASGKLDGVPIDLPENFDLQPLVQD